MDAHPFIHGACNYNPCAMVVGETARFKLTVDPASFVPDADITWIPLSGNHVSYDSDHGRIFEAEAVSTGAQTMAVHIENYAGPPPEIEFTVFPTRHAIPCHFVFVCDGDGTLPSGVTNMQTFAESWISAVNEIYRQVDMEFHVDPEFSTITNRHIYSVAMNGPMTESLLSPLLEYSGTTNGLKVFVIDEFLDTMCERVLYAVTPMVDFAGEAVSLGIVIPSYLQGRFLAHEMGHACGLEDIYWNANSIIQSSALPPTPLRRMVYSSDAANDWTGSVGYYPSAMTISDLISRLLMNGAPDEEVPNTDIPSGPIYGIGYDESNDWEIELQEIGMESLNRNPYTLGLEDYR